MGQQPALRIVQSEAGFIAGGFDAEDNHGKTVVVKAESAIVSQRRPYCMSRQRKNR
jgi:hypothetical protein